MPIKKCGDFMEKNGVVMKRPGKRFVCPPMPEKMKISAEKACGNAREDIEQMNALKEQHWQKALKEEYAAMRRLYYFQELVRFVRRTCDRILCVVPFIRETKRKTVAPDFYATNRSTRQRS